MNEYCKDVLKEMYDRCLKELNKSSKKEQSLLISMIPRNGNTVKRSFLNSAKEIGSSQSTVMNTLKEEGYVKEVGPGQFILSARGILYTEFELLTLSIDHYTEWIDKEYLQFDNEPISDKNRVILLALFAARCFSEETCATYSNNAKESAFIDMLYESNEFLSSLGLVKPDCLESNNKSKSKISTILNQIDKLPSSTGMKFVAANDKKYYIDLISNGGIDRQSITYITRIIMGEKISFDHIDQLEKFCDDQYMKYGYIFATGTQSFDDSISQFQIRNGIEDAAN